MGGERIAATYRGLGFPSAPKFQTALRRQGINVSLDNLNELIQTLGSRQIFRPPPNTKVTWHLATSMTGGWQTY